jgi:hypothetical protein
MDFWKAKQSLAERQVELVDAQERLDIALGSIVKVTNEILEPIWQKHLPNCPYKPVDEVAFTTGIHGRDWKLDELVLTYLYVGPDFLNVEDLPEDGRMQFEQEATRSLGMPVSFVWARE